MSIVTVIIKKGGPGSGHFRHEGRPGLVGGALPDKGASISKFIPGSAPTHEDSANFGLIDRKFIDHFVISEKGKNKMLEDVQQKVANSQLSTSDKEIALRNMNDYYEDDIWFLKAQTAAYLAADTNIEYKKVNDMIGQWAFSANDSNVDSLRSQQAVDEEFGLDVELSDWQKEKLGTIEGSGDLTMDQRKDIVRSMYERTQKDLADAGYKPDDSVILYRGMQHNDFFGDRGDITRYEGNAMESWTFDYDTAKEFGDGLIGIEDTKYGYVLEMKVPIKNILSTPRTGYGCYDVEEVVIFGSIPESRVRIRKKYDFRMLED